MASESLHDFFSLIILVGKSSCQRKARAESDSSSARAKGEEFRSDLNLPQERNSRRNTVAVGQEFGITRVKFGHGKRAPWGEGICEWDAD